MSAIEWKECTNSTYVEPTGDFTKFAELFILLVAFLNIVFNGVSFTILAKNSVQDDNLSKRLLITMCLFEIFLNCSQLGKRILDIVYYRFQATFDSSKLITAALTSTRLFEFTINFFLIMRNWTVVIIAITRTEAVLRPTKSANKRFLRKSTVLICMIIIGILTLVLAGIRIFELVPQVCFSGNKIWVLSMSTVYPFVNYIVFITYCFFPFQIVLPILLISTSTFAMIAFLRVMNKKSTVDSSERNASITRMVLLLLILFVILESPSYIAVILTYVEVVSNEVYNIIYQIATILLLLDSFSNFFVYCLTSESFREKFKQVYCRKCQQTGTRTQHNRIRPFTLAL